MTQKDIFKKAGFKLAETDNDATENKLLQFLKENYPQVIRDGEINLAELKTAAGLPVDEKVNGYGLNFIGRNVARAKYDQKTNKELKINKQFSRDFDTTQNMVLKGDNLDCLKILKSHYSGQIKCIYIDPPYNTAKEDFIYPDRFDKEEAEVLGLANLSENDMDRLEFSFKTKKSHNGWLSFMYPRLMLARDLLADNGVIFISIDDNEQANLKLLMDEIFGEENFVANIIWQKKYAATNDSKGFSTTHDYVISFQKSDFFQRNLLPRTDEQNKPYKNNDNDGKGLWRSDNLLVKSFSESGVYPIINPNTNNEHYPPKGSSWRASEETMKIWLKENRIFFGKDGKGAPQLKRYLNEVQQGKVPITWWGFTEVGHNDEANKELSALFENKTPFDTPKPTRLIKQILHISSNSNDIILDFFAGSGTTAHAVIQLNADDGGNRKFILCQIDEPIKENKPAYKFCKENNLPPFISSITCERIKRAGDKIKKEIEEENSKSGLFEESKKGIPDIGFKVFDLTDAPMLELEDGQIVFQNMDNDSLSRIYNMIFQVGIDSPIEKIECVVTNCMYKIDNNYYITNAEELDKAENKHFFSDAIKNGKVYIDGWTASINTTLQNYKEDVRIVF